MRLRQNRVLEFWDKGKELSIANKDYRNFVNDLFKILLKNDLKNEDITTNSLIKNKNITAYIVAKEDGIIAGLEEFSFLNKDLKLILLKKDGDKIHANEIIVELNGNSNKILERERMNLNLLQRMSGITTSVSSLSKRAHKNVKIAATRKTLLGVIDKKAVSVGGGLTHRLNLNDGILIKDNHLKIIEYDFEKVIDLVKNKSKYIEVEVENKQQALSSALAIENSSRKQKIKNMFAIMLDKIKPSEIKLIVQELKQNNLYDKILLEASGNISENNIEEYSNCGVDVISMGSITSSAKALNMSLEVR